MKKLQVFFDGGCPLCRKEIGIYRKADKLGAIEWVDVSDPQLASALPVPRETLLARFHVLRANGQLISGARGFIVMWRQLPRWRWLGLVMSAPVIPGVLELVYRGFLKIRPIIQRLVRSPSGQ